MDKQVLIFFISLLVTTVAMAKGLEVNLSNLVGPPKLIKYQGSSHAVMDLGGMKYMFKVTQPAIPYPQCNAVQLKGKELMVVSHTPEGYAFFVDKDPVAFKTEHNPRWQTMTKKTYGKK